MYNKKQYHGLSSASVSVASCRVCVPVYSFVCSQNLDRQTDSSTHRRPHICSAPSTVTLTLTLTLRRRWDARPDRLIPWLDREFLVMLVIFSPSDVHSLQEWLAS